jgi:DNA-binding beta-propeller fold protein YncE
MRRSFVTLFAGFLSLAAAPCFGAEPPKAPAAKAAAAPAAKTPAYALAKHFALGGEGGWDYVTADGASKRLYVPRSTRVVVLDTETGKPVGEIPETEGVHGVALAPDLGKGFTSNGRSSTVSVFDLKTLKVLSRVKTTGENPDAILYEPTSKRVFTFNGRGQNATAIDAVSGDVVATIALGGKPEAPVSDASGRVYVNVEDKSEIAVFDAKATAVEKRWPLPGCTDPTGLALDARNGRLFAGCANKVVVILASSDGHLLATVATGEGTDGVAFDPGPGLAFVSSGDGTLTVVHEGPAGTFTAVQTVETQRGARTLTLDEKTHRIFLPTAKFGPPPSPTPDRPRPRPSAIADSFEILVVEPKG